MKTARRWRSTVLLVLLLVVAGGVHLGTTGTTGATGTPAADHTVHLPFIVTPTLLPTDFALLVLPNQLEADTQRSTTVQVALRDANDEPFAAAGIDVVFATTLGRFANNTRSITVPTDTTGTATTELYGVPELGTATVAAQVVTEGGEAQQNTSVTIFAGDCPDIEDNDVPNQAVPINSSVCLAGFPDDEAGEDDYYAVLLNPGDTLNAVVDSIPSGADYDLFIVGIDYDDPQAGVQVLAFSNNAGAFREEATYTFDDFDQPATFFVAVQGLTLIEPPEANTYRLSVIRDPLEGVSTTIASDGTAPPALPAVSGLDRDPPRPSKP